VSSDPVWARLLALNLTKRGFLTHESPQLAQKDLALGDWIVLDISDPEDDWRPVLEELRDTKIAIAVDAELLPSHADEYDADAIVEKSADMRVMTRAIIEAFRSGPVDRELRKLKIRW